MAPVTTKRYTPKKLYIMCVELIYPILEKAGLKYLWNEKNPESPLDKIAGCVAEDILVWAADSGKHWNEAWKLFLTPKIKMAVLKWDPSVIKFTSRRCKNLRRVLFLQTNERFDPSYIDMLPNSVNSVDFDGELFRRGRTSFPKLGELSWIIESGLILKHLVLNRKKLVLYEHNSLVEIHLGTMSATADQLVALLKSPNLRVLRHYQLVTALYKLHADDWRNGAKLPQYKLRNLDADFSHVTRCRMSPQAVLSGDAMRLVITLCPDANSVRVRIDCSTPHDILAPLCNLKALKELSVVCVTSGERCLLDFTDIAPVLEAHGESTLASLELKVIEEVDTHIIAASCPRLETLVLSGCGYVFPVTCCYYQCPQDVPVLSRLRLLFYADGDDFSWDHCVPQCFWKSVLSTGKRKPSRLMGIFLESPRIAEETAKALWSTCVTPLYPDLQTFSAFRYDDLTIENLERILKGSNIYYIRVSECDKIHAKRLRQIFTSPELVIHTD